MLKQIIKSVLGWRLATLLVATVAVYLLPVKDCCADFGSNLSPNYLAGVWANFAGHDFMDIARLGYGAPLKAGAYIFFPLFPVLLGKLATFIPNYLASGLLISHISLVFALYYLYQLVKIDYPTTVAKNTLILLMIFPTAFFLGAVYSESFFLLLVVLSFYLVRRQKFFLACLLAMFASATRFAGIFLWPALAWEIWQGHQKRTKTQGLDSVLVWLTLPPLGLLAYMRYLLVNTGDALLFLKISPDFGPNLVVSKLILLHQVLFRYGKMIAFSRADDPLYYLVILEFAVGILLLVLTVIAFHKLRRSYAIFTLLSYLIPTFTGTFAGMPRFALTIFPVFILLALWYEKQKPAVRKIYLLANIIISIFLIAYFTRGYYIG
jgi:hypothetical protein